MYMVPLNIILPSHSSSSTHLGANTSRKSYLHQHTYHPKPDYEYFFLRIYLKPEPLP
jgi:hypothetical protein